MIIPTGKVLKCLVDLNVFITIVAIIVFAAQITVSCSTSSIQCLKEEKLLHKIHGVLHTLEWTTPINPGHGNWVGEIPEVHRWAYDYGKDGKDFIPQTTPVGAGESKSLIILLLHLIGRINNNNALNLSGHCF